MADIRMSVVKFSTPTATGTMDITGDLGGATPKVAIFYTSRHAPSNDPSGTASIFVGHGATDGTRQFCGMANDPDNQATTNTGRFAMSTACVNAMSAGAGSNVIVGAFSSFGANKITVNFTTVEATARAMICVLLGGADLQAYAGPSGALGAGSTVITGVGFEPDALLVFGYNNSFSASGAADAQLSFGAAINDGGITQKSVVWFSDNGTANEDTSGYFDSDSVRIELSNTGAAIATTTAVTAFSSDGFTISATGATQFGFVALSVGTDAVSLATFTTPTSAGNATISTPSVTPRGVIACLTSHDTLDQLEDDTAESCGMGMSAFTSSESGAVSFSADDDADPTNTQMDCKVHALMCGISGGSPQSIVADYVSAASGSVTVNYTATNGTARYGWALAFGGVPSVVVQHAARSFVPLLLR